MAGLQGRVFGGYQLTEQLNGGGIAEVYRGRHAKTGGREVVVKVIYPEFARQPGFIPHFRQIVQMSGKLANHPHVLPLLASGEEGGYLYLVTPYVAAGTLRDWLRGGGRLGPTDAAPFFHQLCDALGYAHSLSVIHGNIKPSNIFLFEGRHVLLGDFGMLWDISQLDLEHAGSGTEAVEYLAPEVAAGQTSQASDVYSVGAVLFTSLVGRPPFHGTRPADIFAAQHTQPLPHLSQVGPTLPPAIQALDPVIHRALAKRPEERFPSAAALAQAIETTIRQGVSVRGSEPLAQPLGGAMPGSQAPGYGPAFPPAAHGAGLPPFLGMSGAAGMQPFAPAALMGGAAGLTGAANGFDFPAFDSPFAPLPGAANADFSSTPLQPTMRVPAPAPTDFAYQATQHIPSPAGAAFGGTSNTVSWPDLANGLAGLDVGAGSPSTSAIFGTASAPADAPGTPGSASPLSGANGSGSPSVAPSRSGLGQRLGLGRSSGPATGDRSAPSLPPTGGGFLVAGGKQPNMDGPAAIPFAGADSAGTAAGDNHDGESDQSHWPEARGQAQDAALGEFGVYHVGDGWSDGADFSQEHSALQSAAQDAVHAPSWSASESGTRDANDQHTFSPTQLGLPRLTNPDLAELPASWQDLVNTPSTQRNSRRIEPPEPDAYDVGDSAESSAVWERSSADGWSEESRAHSARRDDRHDHGDSADSRDWETGESRAWSIQAPAASTWDESAALSAALDVPDFLRANSDASGKRRGRGARASYSSRSYEDFENEQVWTVGTTAVRKRNRLRRRVALFATLLLLFDLAALVIARPDLCPNSTCRVVSAQIRGRFPFLHTWSGGDTMPHSSASVAIVTNAEHIALWPSEAAYVTRASVSDIL